MRKKPTTQKGKIIITKPKVPGEKETITISQTKTKIYVSKNLPSIDESIGWEEEVALLPDPIPKLTYYA